MNSFFSAVAATYDFEDSNLYFRIVSDGNLAVVASPTSCPYKGDIAIPSTIKVYGSDSSYTLYTVSQIDNSAFANCTDLISVKIPDSVSKIGESAFFGCTSLTSVTMTNYVTSIGSYAFYMCSKLTAINLPSSITKIEPNAFSYSGLESIDIPNKVKTIGKEAFMYCYSLNTVKWSKSIVTSEAQAFYGTNIVDVYIQDLKSWFNVTFIGHSSNPLHRDNYSNVTNLYVNNELVTDLVIPEGISKVNDYAFTHYKLKSITFPSGIESIGTCSFATCMSLEDLVLPNSLITIENTAFGGCINLKTVKIPSSVKEIKEHVFSGCIYEA